jgi:hypothetical protein
VPHDRFAQALAVVGEGAAQLAQVPFQVVPFQVQVSPRLLPAKPRSPPKSTTSLRAAS